MHYHRETLMSLKFEEHRQYLADAHRLSAFARAIIAVVKPGDVVVDLGCGTGILGLMACRAGARRVYAIDSGGMIGVAREVAAANGYADRIVHIMGASTREDVPEPVDVVVADQIGKLGFEAGVVALFGDAARRWLRPGGTLLPGAVSTWVAPVEDVTMAEDVEFWATTPAGFDFSSVSAGAMNTGYRTVFDEGQLLADGQRVVTYEFGPTPSPALQGTVNFTIARAGLMTGLAGWFVADLAPAAVPPITMTNAPGAPDRIQRCNGFLPLGTRVEVQPGDVVDATLRVRPVDGFLAWDVAVHRGTETLVHVRRSTLAGMLLSREILRRTSPASAPRLTAWADARATVLRLCDGERPLADVEDQTATLHPTLFRSRAEAAEFVAEVVTRYSNAAF